MQQATTKELACQLLLVTGKCKKIDHGASNLSLRPSFECLQCSGPYLGSGVVSAHSTALTNPGNGLDHTQLLHIRGAMHCICDPLPRTKTCD
jgi:hypothetical protein